MRFLLTGNPFFIAQYELRLLAFAFDVHRRLKRGEPDV